MIKKSKGFDVKIITTLLSFFIISNIIFADNPSQTHDERSRDQHVEEMVQEGREIIDALFDQARASVMAKENIMTSEWMSKRKDLFKRLQNLHSDATILFTFDEKGDNPFPVLLSQHVNNKVEQELPAIFYVEEVSVKRINDFSEFCHTMCKFNGGSRCGKKIRRIKGDHLDRILLLKAQKNARKKLRKEEAEQLRNTLLFGARG